MHIPAFALLDRLWGSDIKIAGRSGHSLATVGAILLAMGAYFIAGPYAAAGCIAWAAYRSLPFSGGAMAPRPSQIPQALLRQLVAPLLIGVILLLQYQAPNWRMAAFVIYAALATVLAAINGADRGRHNWLIETTRGALYGVAFIGAFSVS